MAFCNAKVYSGFELIAEVANFEQQIGTANLVFTGEGKIDEQTVFGKTISGIAKICKTNRVPLVALAGMVSGNLDRLYEQGLTAAFSIANRPMTLDESKTRAATLLSFAAEQTVRIFHNSEKN
jgi:glycerate kinase